MSSQYLYAGINPAVLGSLRWGLLARGHAEPLQISRPSDLGHELLVGVSAIFVDGPDLRLANILAKLEAIGSKLPVYWIAPAADQKRADPALLARTAAVWEWPMRMVGWSLPGDTDNMALPETEITQPSAISDDEAERLGYLESGTHLAASQDMRLNRLAVWVADYLGVDDTMVNLIGRRLMVNKGRTGRNDMPTEMPREHGMCQFVVAGNQPIVIPDVAASPVFGPMNIPQVRAYMGVPLTNSHNMALGSFCTLMASPRSFTLAEMEVLGAVAQITVETLSRKGTDSAKLQVSGPSFRRLAEAIMFHAKGETPSCLARLPAAAMDAAWDQGLDVVTTADGGDCLVLMPKTTLEQGKQRMAELLSGMGITTAPRIVQAGLNQTWPELLAAIPAV